MDTTDSNVVPLGRHPTPDELMARARALVPILQERAQRCEDQRRVPEETIADFERAGLLRMSQPARYWRLRAGLGRAVRYRRTCSAPADGSQAWLQHIFADHTVLVATFPAQAQDEVWGKNHNTIISASFDPAGRATRVEGGFLYLRPARLLERHRLRRLADLRRDDRGEGRSRRAALLPRSEKRRRGDRRLGDDGAGRHRVEDLRRHRQVHSVASFSRRPPVAFRNRSGHVGQQGGGVSRAAVSAARPRPDSRRWRSAWHAACWRNGWPTPARAPRAASPSARSRGMQILAARSAAEIDAAHALYQTTCAAACASSRRAERRAAPSA